MNFTVSKEEILSGNIFKGLIKLALPLMLLNLINTLYGIVDTYFVGKIGELQVGAVSLVTPITNCGIAFAAGLSAAAIAMISRVLGKGDAEKASSIATHAIVLSIALGLIITTICLVFISPILKWLNTPADIYADTKAYYIGISFDYVFLFILTVYQAIRQASGDSKSGAKINIIASAINAVLDPIFIFIFNMGTFGAAIATVLSKVIMCPIALYKLGNSDSEVQVSLKKYKIEFNNMYKIIKVSIPASLGQFLASFGFVLMSKEIVSYGSIIMSGYGIGSHISSIFYIPVNSIGMALPTYIGQNLGAKNPQRARESYKVSLKLVAIMYILIMAVGFTTSKYIVLLFVSNASEKLMNVSLEYAYYSMATGFCMGWFNSLCGVFNGSTNTKISMILSAGRILFIRMPIVYLLARYTNLQYTGIWVSMIISNLITCITGQIIYFKYPWDKKAITI